MNEQSYDFSEDELERQAIGRKSVFGLGHAAQASFLCDCPDRHTFQPTEHSVRE